MRGRVQRINDAKRKALGAGPGDHDPIVGAQFRRRHDQRGSGFEADPVQHLADGLIGRDPAGRNQRGRAPEPFAEQAQPRAQPIRHDIDHCLLERCAQVADSVSLIGAIFSASIRNAVLRPENEKLACGFPAIGRGNENREALP